MPYASKEKRNAHARHRFATDPAFREAKRVYHKAASRKHWLRWNYGLTLEDRQRLFEIQGNTCGICSRFFTSPDGLQVDHCHATGRIRGLLCGHCNRALGLFADSRTALRSAIRYLERAEALS